MRKGSLLPSLGVSARKVYCHPLCWAVGNISAFLGVARPGRSWITEGRLSTNLVGGAHGSPWPRCRQVEEGNCVSIVQQAYARGRKRMLGAHGLSWRLRAAGGTSQADFLRRGVEDGGPPCPPRCVSGTISALSAVAGFSFCRAKPRGPCHPWTGSYPLTLPRQAGFLRLSLCFDFGICL